MANQIKDQFMQTLQQIEQSHDVEPLVSLFTPDADLGGLGHNDKYEGTDGARRFWKEYLDAFKDIHSDFTHTADGGESAILEWRSDGSLPNGQPISYRGVSLLEFRDGKVSRFRTYYDTAAFLPKGAKHATDRPGANA